MDAERIAHTALLVLVLLVGAALAIVALAPLLFGSVPTGVRRARPWIVAAAILVAVLVLGEWAGERGGFL